MAEFTPIQQARRDALETWMKLRRFQLEALELDFAQQADKPEAVSDEEWDYLVKMIARSQLTFVTRDFQTMLHNPEEFARDMTAIMAVANEDLKQMHAGETKQ